MTNDNQIDPIKAAKELLEKHNVKSAPVNVERIAKQEGARIQFGPLDRELSGMFFMKDGVSFIGVNSLHHPNRQRFTIGHELGHMILHKNIISADVHVDKEPAILRRDAVSQTGTEEIEVQANKFAGYLLVPDFLLEQHLQNDPSIADNEQALEALAKKFKVSIIMMQLRVSQWFKKGSQ